MDKKTLNVVIPVASVVIFFVWGWLEHSFAHSWIIFVIAGGAMAILSNMDKDKKTEAPKPVVKEEPKPEVKDEPKPEVKDENKNPEEQKPEEK